MVNGSLLRAAVADEVERPPRAVRSCGHRGRLGVGAREGPRECVSVSDAGPPRWRGAGTSGLLLVCTSLSLGRVRGPRPGARRLREGCSLGAWQRSRLRSRPARGPWSSRFPAAVTVPVGGGDRTAWEPSVRHPSRCP